MCYLYYIILLTNTSSRNSCKIFAMEIIVYEYEYKRSRINNILPNPLVYRRVISEIKMSSRLNIDSLCLHWARNQEESNDSIEK